MAGPERPDDEFPPRRPFGEPGDGDAPVPAEDGDDGSVDGRLPACAEACAQARVSRS